MRLPAFEDVAAAAERLKGQAVLTPLLRSDALDEATGARVFLKAEPLQRTGSFKFRGAYNRLSQLTADERGRGVVAFSSGNHGQGVALAAKLLDVPAVIVMPSDAPAIKVDATRGHGAEVVYYERWGAETREGIAARIANERGAVVVPSYDDFDIIAGQGTVGLEAAAQLEAAEAAADLLLCNVSGGGLIAGVGLAFGRLSPATEIWGVEPAGYHDHALSLEAGAPTTAPAAPPSLADALLAPRPGDLTFALNRRRLAGAVSVDDAEMLAAMAFAFRNLKLVLEPGGAASLAAALQGRAPLAGRTVLLIASGGNVDPAVFRRALAD